MSYLIPEEAAPPPEPTEEQWEELSAKEIGELLYLGAKNMSIYHTCRVALKGVNVLALHSFSVTMSDLLKDAETYLYFEGKSARDRARLASRVLRMTYSDGGDSV